MNENLAVILMLLFMLAVLAFVWSRVADRQLGRGRGRVFSYGVAALAGSGAVLGAFCLGGAILLPGSPERSSVPVGVLGALILMPYAIFLYRTRKTARAESLLPALVSPQLSRKKKESGWNEFIRETRRPMRGGSLGIPFQDFVRVRSESHFRFWLLVLLMVFWGILFFQVPQPGGWLPGLVISFSTALILAVVYGIACIFILPAIPLLLVLLPLVGLSLLAEAEWRLRFDRPCIEVIRFGGTTTAPRVSTEPFLWLLPLLLGVLIGSVWGSDE